MYYKLRDILISRKTDNEKIDLLVKLFGIDNKDPGYVIQCTFGKITGLEQKLNPTAMKGLLDLTQFLATRSRITKASYVSTILRGMGELAESLPPNYKLQVMIATLLEKFLRLNPSAKEIEEAMCGLGKLADAKKCPCLVKAQATIESLLERFNRKTR